ncbi:MAG: methyltransferase domain-containing protein [Gemmatimonadota bacterium]
MTYDDLTASGRTALRRRALSIPARRLEADGYLGLTVFKTRGTGYRVAILDHGCGRGGDVIRLSCGGYDIQGIDPTHAPWGVVRCEARRRGLLPSIRAPRRRSFDVVLSTYVLNTLPGGTWSAALWDALTYLTPEGTAYITVRRDCAEGRTKRGTYQNPDVQLGCVAWLALDWDVVTLYKCRSYETYKITRKERSSGAKLAELLAGSHSINPDDTLHVPRERPADRLYEEDGCRRCGIELSLDGYDGLCGSCADREK